MRVLFVYCYCTMGGVETGMRFRITGLAAHGIVAHGVFLRDYGGKDALKGLEDRVFVGADEKRFLRILSEGAYDVVSVIDSFEVFDWLEKGAYAGRVVVELRSTYEHTLKKLVSMSGRRVDAILVPSHFQARNIQPFLPKDFLNRVPVHVVPNFVALDAFSTVGDPNANHHTPIVCWIGRIDPHKNWPEFLEICQKLAARDGLEFWMVGGGRSDAARREEFRRALGQRLDVAARLRWWPILHNKAMPRLYSTVAASGGCVLLTSKCESFGFAALEAQACGCPVVAAEVGGLVEVVEDGSTGFLYPLGNAGEAAKKVAMLLDEPRLHQALRESGPRLMRERFDPNRCLATFAQALRGTASTERCAIEAT